MLHLSRNGVFDKVLLLFGWLVSIVEEELAPHSWGRKFKSTGKIEHFFVQTQDLDENLTWSLQVTVVQLMAFIRKAVGIRKYQDYP